MDSSSFAFAALFASRSARLPGKLNVLTFLLMETPLLNQVALVTGSGKRLGREVALGLAQRGADVVIHYRSSADDARKVVAEIEKLGRRSIALQADLDDLAQIRALFENSRGETRPPRYLGQQRRQLRPNGIRQDDREKNGANLSTQT